MAAINEENPEEVPDVTVDPNKSEVKCSCGLMFGIGMSFLITFALAIILVLYIFCQLEYQVDHKCYYKEHRLPNVTKHSEIYLFGKMFQIGDW